ncbi:restriction endonuclease subunit S [uncultured Polaribacter sp.]|uniref:restriction endonuclease subunit S n=1 Tax=uncultured Polaribacter sp. TaxID=174711 RepID=UPI00259B45E3|nr:restriction endonuclease subunit S [uncultured Polaribacter sp.]
MKLLQHFKELTIRPKNAKELKGLILQLAIQGKLTANWRQENPEVKLDYKKLIEISEKNLEFLTKESNSINQLDVPTTWLKLKFKTLFEMQGGSQPPKSKFSSTKLDGYIRLYQIRDFGKKPVPVYVPKESVSKLCTEDDVMIGRYGASIGKIFYGKNGAYNVALVRLIWNRDLLEQNFVYQTFSSFYMQEFFQNCTRSAQAGFNKTDMGKLNIPLPPLEEQKEIVKVVETLFKEIEQLEQLTVQRIGLKEDFVTSALHQLTTNNANQEWTFLQDHFKSFFNETTNIKKLRETVLQLAVQGKLTADWRSRHPELVSGSNHASQLLKRIQEEKAQLIKDKKIKKEKALPPITKDEIPYELPNGWVWCRLGNYAHYGALSKYENEDASIDTWVLELEDIEKGSSELLKKVRFSERDFKSTKSVFKSSDVIYGKLRPYLDKVIVADEDGVCTTEMIPIKSFGSSNPEYLRWYLKHPDFIEYANSSTHGMRMPRMGTDVAKKVLISVPSLEEQKVIVEKVNTLMSLCNALEQEVQQSQKHSELLMQSVLREVFEN